MNKTIPFSAFLIVLFASCGSNTESLKPEKTRSVEQTIEELKIVNLLRDSLGLAEGIEVVISYIELPKNTSLPSHYHPGEEFVYLIQGSGELTLKDKSKIIVKAGETAKVPLRHVHSFSSLDEDVKAVVFRVHEKGQADRTLVE